jgi:hypothetical protein
MEVRVRGGRRATGRTLTVLFLGLALLGLGLAPAASGAAMFYARGGGGNTKASCAQGDECNLQKAVKEANAAGPGSSVVLVPGPEFTPSSPVLMVGIDVGGEPGAPRPTVVAPSEEEAFGILSGANLHDVNVISEDTFTPLAVVEGSVERAFVESKDAGAACLLFNAVLIDTVCLGREADGVQMGGSTATYHAYLHNVDAIGSLIGIQIFAPLEAGKENRLEATNTIAIGGPTYDDVSVSGDAGGAQALFSNSDYAATNISGASENLRITAAGTGGNIIAPPQFVAASSGDFHQLATSPTVDAGLTVSTNGELDLDRNPRALSAHPTCDSTAGPTDIGAYELVAPVPTCAPPPSKEESKDAPPPPAPVPAPAPGTSLKRAKIDADAGTATFTFAGSGQVTGFACELIRPHRKGVKAKKPKFASCGSPKAYKHLTPGHYTFKVEAGGAGGVDPSPAVRKFRIPG